MVKAAVPAVKLIGLPKLKTVMTFLSRPYNPDEVSHSPSASNGIGVNPQDIKGFRAPFLDFNDNTFKAMISAGFIYDTSIQEGFQSDQNGGQHYWPYTLDNGSPGNDVIVSFGNSEPISNYPGFWEIPVYPFIVPDDAAAPSYGVSAGFRAKLKEIAHWFSLEQGKITGFDYNLLYNYKMQKAELLATLKHTLDVRLAGNRAPMMIGAHTDLFHDLKTDAVIAQMRREVLEEFLDYALAKTEVRIVRFDQLLDWMRAPVALGADFIPKFDLSSSVTANEIPSNQCSDAKWSASKAYISGNKVDYNNETWTAAWGFYRRYSWCKPVGTMGSQRNTLYRTSVEILRYD